MRLFGRRDAVTCRRAIELVTSYLDESLPAEQRRELDHHFATCPNCAEYVSQLRLSIAATGRVEPAELSEQTRSALLDLYRQTRP